MPTTDTVTCSSSRRPCGSWPRSTSWSARGKPPSRRVRSPPTPFWPPAFPTAFDFCQTHGVSGRAKVCLGCLAYVLRKTGEWDRVIEIYREVIAAGEAPRNARCAAIGEFGLVHVLRGDTRRAQAPLAEAFAL